MLLCAHACPSRMARRTLESELRTRRRRWCSQVVSSDIVGTGRDSYLPGDIFPTSGLGKTGISKAGVTARQSRRETRGSKRLARPRMLPALPLISCSAMCPVQPRRCSASRRPGVLDGFGGRVHVRCSSRRAQDRANWACATTRLLSNMDCPPMIALGCSVEGCC